MTVYRTTDIESASARGSDSGRPRGGADQVQYGKKGDTRAADGIEAQNGNSGVWRHTCARKCTAAAERESSRNGNKISSVEV